MPSRNTRLSMEALFKFLEAVDEVEPASLYRVAKEAGLRYERAQRYLKFCIEMGLVVNLGRGPRRGFRLSLSEEGRRFLRLLRSLQRNA